MKKKFNNKKRNGSENLIGHFLKIHPSLVTIIDGIISGQGLTTG